MPQIARATIRDVAREAGVGTTTVSRVINGGKLVAPAVRMRVERVMLELEYQPSQAARSLAQERSRSIGLIVPRLVDPFFSTFATVAQSVCRANNHTLLISTSSDTEEQTLEELQTFERYRVDGLIIVPPAGQSLRIKEYCQRLSERVVAVDLPVSGSSISCVQTNNAEAMASAVRHLVGHRRKRILLLASDPGLHTMRERRRGYLESIASANLKPLIEEHIDSFASAEEAILRTFKTRASFDGLVAANNTLGIYAFQVMQKHGIAVPSSVGFICFDDFTLADTVRPSVTCVAQPIEALSRVATELLFRQLDQPQTPSQRIQLPSKMILRESCGCPL